MDLREIMTPTVESVTVRTSVQEAARRMAEMNIGFLVVCNDSGPCGVVTDRDIVLRVVAEGLDPATPVDEAMTPMCEVLDEATSVEEAAAIMKDKQIRRLVYEVPTANSPASFRSVTWPVTWETMNSRARRWKRSRNRRAGAVEGVKYRGMGILPMPSSETYGFEGRATPCSSVFKKSGRGPRSVLRLLRLLSEHPAVEFDRPRLRNRSSPPRVLMIRQP